MVPVYECFFCTVLSFLSVNILVHFYLDLFLIHLLQIFTGVATISEPSSINNIIGQVLLIYSLPNFKFFDSIILFHFTYNNIIYFILSYYDASIACIQRINNNITTQHQKNHQTAGKIDIYIASFMFSFTVVIVLTLFSYYISFHCYLLLVTSSKKEYLQKYQQYHKTAAETRAEGRYNCFVVCVLFFHIFSIILISLYHS